MATSKRDPDPEPIDGGALLGHVLPLLDYLAHADCRLDAGALHDDPRCTCGLRILLAELEDFLDPTETGA